MNKYNPSISILIFIIILTICSLSLYFALQSGLWPFQASRRKRVFAKALPKRLINIIEKNVLIYNKLPENFKRELHGHINVLLALKNFEGCGGLKLTDEIKVTIAANASLLLLNKKTDYFPKLSSILVYPSSYIVKESNPMGPAELEEEDVLDGESSGRGAIVLAWDQIKNAKSDLNEAYNLVLHEFAHQFEFEKATPFGNKENFADWIKVFSSQFKIFQRKVKSGKKIVLDDYGAEDLSEFFSVATETFFENPSLLKSKMPELYKNLSEFYNLDPVSW